jgi:hypothetical protein
MTRYFEVTGSWGNIIAVEDGPAIGFDKEQQAIDWFCDNFDLKEFFRGVEAREVSVDPEDAIVTLDSYGDPVDDDD